LVRRYAGCQTGT